MKKKKEKTSILPERCIIQMEANYLIYPIGFLSKSNPKTKILFKKQYGSREFVWDIRCSSGGELPGPSDIETDMAISKIIHDRGKPVSRYLETSYSEIAKQRNQTPAGSNIQRIANDLKKLASITIHEKYAFKKKWDLEQPRSLEEKIHRKYDVVYLKGDDVSDNEDILQLNGGKKISDKVYIVLGETYYQSLLSNNTKKIDYNFLMYLDGAVSKRLYMLLCFAIATNEHERGYITYEADELYMRLPVDKQEPLFKAKGLMKRYTKQLIDTKYLANYEWSKGKEVYNRGKDVINFYPGEYAYDELISMRNKIKVESAEKYKGMDEAKRGVVYFIDKYKLAREPMGNEIKQAREFGSFDLIKHGVDYIAATFPNWPAKHFGSINFYKDLIVSSYQSVVQSRAKKEEASKRLAQDLAKQENEKIEREKLEAKAKEYYEGLTEEDKSSLEVKAREYIYSTHPHYEKWPQRLSPDMLFLFGIVDVLKEDGKI